MSTVSESRRGTLTVKRFGADRTDLIREMRTTYIKIVEDKDYEGFLREYDRQFDSQSTFFLVRNSHNRIVGTTRVVERVEGHPLPFEKARIQGTEMYLSLPPERPVAELTSFWFDSKESLTVLVSQLAHYTGARYDSLYATYDPTMELDRLYKFLNFDEPRPDLRLVYEDFYRHGQQVLWGVLKISRSGINAVAERSRFSLH